MDDLKESVLTRAQEKDWLPTRELLDEIGQHLPEMPIKDPLRDWWLAMLMSHLRGQEEPSRKTRDANQMLLLAVNPQVKDKDDWDLTW